jgi:hypothetical protein
MNNDHRVKIDGSVQIAGASGFDLNLQPAKAFAVTIANKDIYEKGILFIGTGGNIAVIPADNPDAGASNPTGWVIFKNIPDGTFFPIPVIRVGDAAAGTSATDIVFCS